VLYLLSFALMLIAIFKLRIVVPSIDAIVHSQLLGFAQHFPVSFLLLLPLSFVTVAGVSSIDDVVHSTLLRMDVSIMVLHCLEPHLLKIAVVVLLAVYYVVSLVRGISMLLLTVIRR
jgi:hypothetical protein